jgi:predicted O-methyltransferase YrrM
MSEELWSRIDGYISDVIGPDDEVLAAALAASHEAGLPNISVSSSQGKLLHLLAAIQGARRILEIGTLGGYSTIHLARALPRGGRLVTLELSPRHAEVARANIARAGLDGVVEVVVGAALESLAELVRDRSEPFDFVFIDADKQNIPQYFERALELTRPGSVIVVDNVVRGGRVLDAASDDPNVQGVRRFNERLRQSSRTSATTIQTVGVKGHDGFTLIRVGGER